MRSATIVLALVATFCGVAIQQLIQSNQQSTIDEAVLRLDATARVVTEHLDQSFRAVNVVINSAFADHNRLMSGEIEALHLHTDELGSDDFLTGFTHHVEPVLAASIASLPQFDTYIIAGKNGRVVSSSKEALIDINISDRSYFEAVRDDPNRAFLSEPVVARGTGAKVVPLSWAILDENREFAGAIAINFAPDFFSRTAEQLVDGYPSATIQLAYSSGLVFAASNMPSQGTEAPQSVDSADELIRVQRASSLLPLQIIATQPTAVVLGATRSWITLVWIGYAVVLLGITAILLTMGRALTLAHQAEELANYTERTKSQFLAMVSHEIRTPLTGLQGIADLLLQERLTKRQRDYVKSMASASRSMHAIIDDVLDVEKLERGQLELRPKPHDLGSLVAEVEDLYRNRAADNGIQLGRKVPDGVPIVMIDGLRLTQIIRNFVSNAVKFTKDGRITIDVKYTPPPEGMEAGTLRVAVTDTGVGIPIADQPRVFERFSQFHEIKDRGAEGTGLGLAICKLLAEAMGGEVGFRSTPGQGTTFWVRLPATAAESAEAKTSEASTTSQPSPRDLSPAEMVAIQTTPSERRRILVVDDVELNRQVVQDYLRRQGHSVTTAANGTRALDAMTALDFDAVLIDLNLPDMNGWELAEAIRNQGGRVAETPLLAFSAANTADIQERMAEFDFIAHIGKPIRWPLLMRHLAALPRRDLGSTAARPAPTPRAIQAPGDAEAKPSTSGQPVGLGVSKTASTMSSDELKAVWSKALSGLVLSANQRQELIDNLGEKAVARLTKNFLDAMAPFESAIESGDAAADNQIWRQACHDMKGMAGSMGADQLSRLSGILTRHGWPSSDEKEIVDYLEDLKGTVSATKMALQPSHEAHAVE
ncbi:MAG: response regulator [Alphaproteobacteria bacterium]|nr:response regulator [Alphaproteobacteria bacterium SS10]